MYTKIDARNIKEAVFEIISSIPYGRATSYGAIAKAIGYPNHARMIGRILSENNLNINIPVHRVVNSNGQLSGKDAFGKDGEMQKLLEKEGLLVVNDKIQNWKQVFWAPIDEIKI